MRSWLYCPGNNPKMIINAGIYGADALVFDLEDAVAESHKIEARYLLAQAFAEGIIPVEKSAVRINGFESEHWRKDLEEIIPAGGRMIRIPKVESPQQVSEICAEIDGIEKKSGIPRGLLQFSAFLKRRQGWKTPF